MKRCLLVCVLVACDSDPASEPVPTEGGTVVQPVAKPEVEVSRAASRLALYKQKEHGKPAALAGIGQPIRIYDFDIKLEQPVLADPETRLPWIANLDERAQFRGKRALIIPFTARNDAPVARGLDIGMVLHTPDGKTHVGGVYNERLAAKQRGRTAWYDLPRFPPDKWLESVLVYEVDPKQLEGAVLYIARWVTVRDRYGRSRSVVEQQLVADLPAAIEGPPIRAK